MLDILKRKTYNNYFAHISKYENETLFEHTKLVSNYFQKLIEEHKLEVVINNLIKSLVSNDSVELIKNIFMAVPEYHDIGKINPNFQHLKMGNKRFKPMNLEFGSDHSKIGSFLFIQNYFPLVNNTPSTGQEKILNAFILFAFSFPIKKHHSSSLDFINKYNFNESFIEDLFSILSS